MYRADTGLGREGRRLAGARETELPPPERGGRRGAEETPAAFGARSRKESGSAAATLRPQPGHCCRCSELPFWPRAAPRRCSPAAVRPGTGHPGVRLLRPRAAAGAAAALPTFVPPRPDKLPPSQARGLRRLAAAPSPGFPSLRLQAPSPGAASFLPAPLQPRAPGAYRSLRLRSNKAGGPEATGRGAGSGSGGARARRRHPWAGRAQRAGTVGTWRAEKGEESILLSARTPSTLVFARPRSPCCPCPSASGCPGGSWQGQRGRQRGRSGLAGEPLPYLCPE